MLTYQLFWVMVILLTLLFIPPLLWMLITSFKTVGESQPIRRR